VDFDVTRDGDETKTPLVNRSQPEAIADKKRVKGFEPSTFTLAT